MSRNDAAWLFKFPVRISEPPKTKSSRFDLSWHKIAQRTRRHPMLQALLLLDSQVTPVTELGEDHRLELVHVVAVEVFKAQNLRQDRSLAP